MSPEGHTPNEPFLWSLSDCPSQQRSLQWGALAFLEHFSLWVSMVLVHHLLPLSPCVGSSYSTQHEMSMTCGPQSWTSFSLFYLEKLTHAHSFKHGVSATKCFFPYSFYFLHFFSLFFVQSRAFILSEWLWRQLSPHLHGSGGEGGHVGPQVKAYEFSSLLCHWLATWPQQNHVTSLCLSFFIFKMRVFKLFLKSWLLSP